MNAFEVEQLLFETMECNMYRLPPLQNTAGHKASEWQDKMIWTGICKVVAKGNTATVKLLEADGTVFAQCPIQTGADAPKSMTPAIDSSRYFVLRIEDKGKHAYIGIGFKDRDEAFDFKVSITDHKRQETRSESQPVYTGPKQDLELKQGAKIVVNLGGKVKPAEKKSRPSGGLAPPPSRVMPPPSNFTRPPPQQVKAPEQSNPFQPAPRANQQQQQQQQPTPSLFQQPQPQQQQQSAPSLFQQPQQQNQPQQVPQQQQVNLFGQQPQSQQQPQQQASGLDFLLADPKPHENIPFDPFEVVAPNAPVQQQFQAPIYQQQSQNQQPLQQPLQQPHQPPPQVHTNGDLLDFGPEDTKKAKSSILDAFAPTHQQPPTQKLQNWDPFQ